MYRRPHPQRVRVPLGSRARSLSPLDLPIHLELTQRSRVWVPLTVPTALVATPATATACLTLVATGNDKHRGTATREDGDNISDNNNTRLCDDGNAARDLTSSCTLGGSVTTTPGVAAAAAAASAAVLFLCTQLMAPTTATV